MDSSANIAITIATGLFVTIMITSGVLFTLSQIQNIYAEVYDTDINIQNRFDEYDAYVNTQKTGIDVINTIKKYRNDELVVINVGGVEIQKNNDAFVNNFIAGFTSPGERLYNSTVVEEGNYTKIVFTSAT